jgi:hypothetical protein
VVNLLPPHVDLSGDGKGGLICACASGAVLRNLTQIDGDAHVVATLEPVNKECPLVGRSSSGQVTSG